jgi:hypothetical protein
MEGGLSSLPRHSVGFENLNIKVEPTKAASQACVLVGFSIKANPMVLLSLKNNSLYPFDGDDVDVAIVAYCAFQNIYKELFGNAQVAAANKVSNVNVGYNKGEFLISAVCDKTVSSVRKVSGIIVKNLKFSTVIAQYKIFCSMLNIKPDVGGFASAVNECNASVDTNVNIAITGKVNISKKAKVEDMAVPISNKMKDLQKKEGGKKRSVSNDQSSHGKLIEVILPNGLDGVIAKEYLDTFLMKTECIDGLIILPERMGTMLERLNNKDKMGRFADKLDKLGDNLSGALSYTASVECIISTKDVSSGKEVDFSKIKSALSSIYK